MPFCSLKPCSLNAHKVYRNVCLLKFTLVLENVHLEQTVVNGSDSFIFLQEIHWFSFVLCTSILVCCNYTHKNLMCISDRKKSLVWETLNVLECADDRVESWHFDIMFTQHHFTYAICDMPCVMCHIKCVRCHMSCVTCKLIFVKILVSTNLREVVSTQQIMWIFLFSAIYF